MQLTVNYSYVEQIVPPRCRKPRPQRFDDGVAVLNIREVTTEQAPVAIIGIEQDAAGEHTHEPVAYHWFDGKLWTNCPLSDCSRDRSYQQLGHTLDLVTDSSTVFHAETGIYVSLYDGKEVIAKYLSGVANGLLIIDGQLHRPAGEPRYRVMTFGLSHNHGGTFLSCANGLNPNLKPEAYFSLLELNEAIEYTRKVAEARGDTVKVGFEPGFRFEVLIPQAVQWKNPSLQAEEAATAA